MLLKLYRLFGTEMAYALQGWQRSENVNKDKVYNKFRLLNDEEL